MTRISFEQVEAFVCSVDAGSFSAAARRLGRSQSTISSAIANLEIAVGLELFDRSSRVPSLTAAGKALLRDAQDLYVRAQRLEAHGDALGAGAPPTISLALGIPNKFAVAALHDFALAFPFTEVVINNPVRGDVAALVANGSANLGLGFALPKYSQGLGFTQLGRLIMSHVAHRDHPLAHIERPSFDDLRQHRRLANTAQARSLPTSEYVQALQTWTSDSYDALIALALAGVGWATVPRQLVSADLATGELVELDLEPYPHTDWLIPVDLLWRVDSRLSAAEEWLLERFRSTKIAEPASPGRSTTP